MLLVQSASLWLTIFAEGVANETQEAVVPVETIERPSLPEERIGVSLVDSNKLLFRKRLRKT